MAESSNGEQQPKSANNPNPAGAAKRVSVAVWFDMQPDSVLDQDLPLWARQLAQAHINEEVLILAHEESAYARAGLVCELVKGVLWPEESWLEVLRSAIERAQAARMQQVILVLPSRASTTYWGQWGLLELPKLGAGLDNLTGLLQGNDNWQRTLLRADCGRWLILDRVITYGAQTTGADFVQQMRAFNPLARWVHNGFNDEQVLLQSVNAYHKNMPLMRIPLKYDDLNAWGANKVVYFATSNQMNGPKVIDLFESWRQNYSQKMVRLWAVVRIKGVQAPLSVTSVHHLWASGLAAHVAATDFPENRFWILGEQLDATQLQAEFDACND